MDHDASHNMTPTNNLAATAVKNQRSLAAQISQTLYQLHEPPSLSVNKGQVEIAASNLNLLYPDASSGLTFTHVDVRGNKVGGYGMLTSDTQSDQNRIDTIMSMLNVRIDGRSGKLLITGNEAIWNQELLYNSTLFSNVATIIAYLQRNNLATTLHLLNITHYMPTSLGDAPVMVKVGRDKYSITTNDNQTLLQNHW